MNYDMADCPYCDTEFHATPWQEGRCPNCGVMYYWNAETDCEGNECPLLVWEDTSISAD